jgi:hypothetical protein
VIKLRLRAAAAAGLIGLASLAAGCGTAVRPGAISQDQPRPLSLATATTTAGGTWAVVVVGGSAAQHNNFWQLLVRPPASQDWRLVTPPGVASNGGLLIAPLRGASLVAGFRPSQGLIFTPLASTDNDGAGWSAGVADAALADGPDAMAADAASGKLLALATNGSIQLGDADGTSWTTIAGRHALTGQATTRGCRLSLLTGVAFDGDGAPLAAGDCREPGVAGIYRYAAGRWQAAGPALAPAFADDQISVLAITSPAGHPVALLQAGAGASARLLAASLTGSGWSVSAPARLGGRSVSSLATSDDGSLAVLLTGGRALSLTGQGKPWQVLAGLPAKTQALAFGPGAQLEAVAPGRTTVSFLAYQASSTTWTLAQKLKVPVQFGSSS